MMLRIFTIAAVVFAGVGTVTRSAMSANQSQPPDVSESQFWGAARAFSRQPIGREARVSGKTVMLFALKSKRVAVFLAKTELGWFGEHARYKPALMTAYLAGNIGAQLRTGVKRNDRYAGILHLLQTYRTIRKQDPNYRNPQVDQLLKLHQAGRLLAHVVELEESDPSDVEKLKKPTRP